MQANYEKLCEAAWIKQKLPCKTTCNAPLMQCFETKCNTKFPNFTAEKQIELIKLIIIDGTLAPMHLITEGRENKYIIGVHGDYHFSHADFSEALAGLALQLIEAGELDKEEVRKVLE